MLMMPTCEEVCHKIASDEFADGGWWQRLWYQLHLLLCYVCRGYAAQVQAIGKGAQRLAQERATDAEPEVLRRLEDDILRHVPHPSAGSDSTEL